MPQVDLTQHPCKWCGTTERTFVCDDCNKYTCRECKLGIDEAGCIHRRVAPVRSQTWCEASGVRLDPKFMELAAEALVQTGKFRLVQDS